METNTKKSLDKRKSIGADRLKFELLRLIKTTPCSSPKTLINTWLAFNGISRRSLAREVSLSHTIVNRVLSGQTKTGYAADKVFQALGIDNPYVF